MTAPSPKQRLPTGLWVLGTFILLGALVAVGLSFTTLGDDDPASSPSAAPVKSAQPPGSADFALLELITEPGKYVVGEDIAPGKWAGISSSPGSCTFQSFEADGYTAGPYELENGESGTDGNTQFLLKTEGRALEIGPSCLFWNDSPEHNASPKLASPAEMTTPWRGVADELIPAKRDSWMQGQSEYIDALRRQGQTQDQTELLEMGLFTCRFKASGGADIITEPTLMKYGGLSEVDADAIANASTTFLCEPPPS